MGFKGGMKMNFNSLGKDDLRSWYGPVTFNLRAEMDRLAKLAPDKLREMDFTKLREHLDTYEEFRVRAKEVGFFK